MSTIMNVDQEYINQMRRMLIHMHLNNLKYLLEEQRNIDNIINILDSILTKEK